jgi:hypothetical protein
MYALPCSPSHSHWPDHLHSTWWAVRIARLLILQLSPAPCYLFTLRIKYLPQRPILEHHQPTLLPPRERPSFTPIKTTCKIIVLYILILIFLCRSRKQKILHRTVACALRKYSPLNFSLKAILVCQYRCHFAEGLIYYLHLNCSTFC